MDYKRSERGPLREWAANTELFHCQARYRKCKNFISKLHVDGRLVTSQADKEAIVWELYHGLLGVPLVQDIFSEK